MLKTLTKMKNLLLKIVVILGVITLALCTRINTSPTKIVQALNKEDVSEDKLTAPNFYSSSTSYISSNSHWKTNIPNDETNADSFKKGIVNVEKIEEVIKADTQDTAIENGDKIVNNLWDKYGLFTSPGKLSNITIDKENQDGIYNYLMINTTDISGHMGYTSDKFNLDKGSFYRIAVTLKTINDSKVIDVKESKDDETTQVTRSSDAKASIYLNGVNTDIDTEYELINTNNQWQTYEFYISTSSFNSCSDVSLDLFLGSKTESCKGVVFFSDVKIEQYSESKYIEETEKISSLDNKKIVIDMNNSYDYDFVANASFEDSNIGNSWSTIGSRNTGNVFYDIIDTTSNGYIKGDSKYPAIPDNNNSNRENIKALALYSDPSEDKATFYGVQSNEFIIKQYGLYRISVWAYSNSNASKGAYITLKDADNADNTVSQQISTTASSGSSLCNNWKEYDFYIQGNSLRDTNLQLQLTIGSASSGDTEKNYAIFDDIRVQEIDYAQYNSGKTDSNTLSLTPTNTNSMITNYTFDAVEQELGNSKNGPLKPSSWTGTTPTGTYSGVINTNETLFDANKSNYGIINNLINPGSINQLVNSNNVLMMGTSYTNKAISYKTASTFKFEASSYYEVSFDVYTQNLTDSTKGANVSITDSNNIELMSIKNIQTNNEWEHHTYYIATNLAEKNCDMTLSLVNTDAYAYFDNIRVNKIESALYEEYKESKDDKQFFDLSKNLFGNANAWKTTGNTDNATVGFLEADEHTSSRDEAIAYITSETADVSYKITYADTISLSASSYYKISAYINTDNIAKLTADGHDEYGASFMINFEDKMQGIENIITDTNSFEQFVLYVQTTGASDINIIFGLGHEDNKVSGIAYFTDLQIEKLADEAAMTADKEANSDIKTITIKGTEDKTEDSETDDTTTPQAYGANWLAISSLITSAAMIVAVFAYFIRKIDWKKRTKKVSTDYDRRSTLDKRYDMKERIEYRESLITALNQELSNLKDTTAKVKAESESKLEALRSTADDSSENLKKQMKELYNKKLEISKEHNALIAKDKLNASKEEDLIYNDKIAKIEKEEKAIAKKIKFIEKAYDREKAKYDALIERSNTRQEEIKSEIYKIKEEIKSINDELINLNTGKSKK
ncbi:MAG: hypothetical protein E7361_01365 [Clostridiales bacterium]|nr:hypothetical protein [Clostridiales bacterium]